MSIRLVAAAKGLAVGVLTLAISVAGAYAYVTWRSSGCPRQSPDCQAGLEALGILLEGLWVLFFLMLALGPLLGWAFRLPLPGRYVIPPFLIAFVDIDVLPKYVNGEHSRFPLLVVPFIAYPLIAALSADGRPGASAPAPSPAGPASPDEPDSPEPG